MRTRSLFDGPQKGFLSITYPKNNYFLSHHLVISLRLLFESVIQGYLECIFQEDDFCKVYQNVHWQGTNLDFLSFSSHILINFAKSNPSFSGVDAFYTLSTVSQYNLLLPPSYALVLALYLLGVDCLEQQVVGKPYALFVLLSLSTFS